MGPNLGLAQALSTPFRPMAICSLHLMSWKTAFPVSIMSARRVGELCGMTPVFDHTRRRGFDLPEHLFSAKGGFGIPSTGHHPPPCIFLLSLQ